MQHMLKLETIDLLNKRIEHESTKTYNSGQMQFAIMNA